MPESEFILDGIELDKFCKTWIGSGDTNPEIVFVGLEFSSEAKNKARITSFFDEIKKLNYPSIIAEYNSFVNTHTKKWDKKFDFETSRIGAKNTTRHRMCLMAFGMANKIRVENKMWNSKEFRSFENRFANDKSKTAALELFPLPCESEKDFKYQKKSWVNTALYPQFQDKSTYRNYYLQQRKKVLKKYLDNPNIRYIILYSMSHKKEYEEILDIKFDKKLSFENKKSFYIKKEPNKTIILLEHFCSFGFSYNYMSYVIEKAF